MSEHISDNDAQLVKEILDGWPLNEKLTWDELVKAIAARRPGGTSWSRQALPKHVDIYGAYELKKAAQRVYRKSPPPAELDKDASPELQTALKTIEKLDSENARLQLESQRFKEMFVRWAQNAHSYNITEEMLNKPLIEQDRGKSKK